MLLLTPVQWLVQLIAVAPDLLRPGLFVALVLVALWIAFVQRALPDIWHALCRLSARLVDGLVGLLLLPDYLTTTARQEQGQEPPQAVLVLGRFAERVLDGAGALYERHQRPPIEWKPFPWLPVLIVAAVATVPWAVMEITSPRSAVRQELAQAFGVWRDVEAWAGVAASRRAAPGVSWPPRPRVMRIGRHGRAVSVKIRCRVNRRCQGRLILRNGAGKRLNTRKVSIRPHHTATVRMRLPRRGAGANRVLVRVARVNPG